MNIRRAQEKDMKGINDLLYQVLMVHHNGRPDLFKDNTKITSNISDLNGNNSRGSSYDKKTPPVSSYIEITITSD